MQTVETPKTMTTTGKKKRKTKTFTKNPIATINREQQKLNSSTKPLTDADAKMQARIAEAMAKQQKAKEILAEDDEVRICIAAECTSR